MSLFGTLRNTSLLLTQHYRLHPRYLLTESPTDLTEAYWACQSGGAPNVDPETGFPYPEFPTKGTIFDPERHRR